MWRWPSVAGDWGVPVPGRGYWGVGSMPGRRRIGLGLPERESKWRDDRLLTVSMPAEKPVPSAVTATLGDMALDWDAIDAAWLRNGWRRKHGRESAMAKVSVGRINGIRRLLPCANHSSKRPNAS